MGGGTEYDVLTGSPGSIFKPDEDAFEKFSKNYDKKKDEKWNKRYKWQEKIRAVKKNGEVTIIGYHEDRSIVFPYKSGLEDMNLSHSVSDDNEGYMINDVTYQYLKKNPLFKKCVGNKNLYTLLTQYMKTAQRRKNMGPAIKYDGAQYLGIGYKNKEKLTEQQRVSNGDVLKRDEWVYVNPKLNNKEGRKNKKRIKQIITDFLEFCCKKMNKQSKSRRKSKKRSKSRRKSKKRSKSRRNRSKSKRRKSPKRKSKNRSKSRTKRRSKSRRKKSKRSDQKVEEKRVKEDQKVEEKVK